MKKMEILKNLFSGKDYFVSKEENIKNELNFLKTLKKELEEKDFASYYRVFFPNSRLFFILNTKAQAKLNFFPKYKDEIGIFSPLENIQEIRGDLDNLKIQILSNLSNISNENIDFSPLVKSLLDSVSYLETFKAEVENIKNFLKTQIFGSVTISTKSGKARVETYPLEYSVFIDPSSYNALTENFKIEKFKDYFEITLFEKIENEYTIYDGSIIPKNISFIIFYNGNYLKNKN